MWPRATPLLEEGRLSRGDCCVQAHQSGHLICFDSCMHGKWDDNVSSEPNYTLIEQINRGKA